MSQVYCYQESPHILQGRLIGGKQVDLALKKVRFRESIQRPPSYMLTLLTLIVLLCFLISFSSLSIVCFSGSIRGWASLILEMCSFRGDSFRFFVLEDEMMMSVICSSQVEGKSSRSSFLPVFVAVFSFRLDSIGNASRLFYSLVSNLRLQSLPAPLILRLGDCSCSSKNPKKEVFSGETCNFSDSAFLWMGGDYCISGERWKRQLRLRLLMVSFLRKKSPGNLFLLILMRLILALGSLNRWLLSSLWRCFSIGCSNSENCFLENRFYLTINQLQSIDLYNYLILPLKTTDQPQAQPTQPNAAVLHPIIESRQTILI